MVVKTCGNCLRRHGLDIQRCVSCWQHPNRPYWINDGTYVDGESSKDCDNETTKKTAQEAAKE